MADEEEKLRRMKAWDWFHGLDKEKYTDERTVTVPLAAIADLVAERDAWPRAVENVINQEGPVLADVKHMCGGSPTDEDLFSLGVGAVELRFARLLRKGVRDG